MIWRMLFMLILSVNLAGCAGFEELIKALNEREGLSSCIHYNGSMRVGRVIGGHVAIDGVTVTGKAKIEECAGYKQPVM